MRQIHTEIIIQASAQRVWDVLTDFEAYPQWNPLITSVQGQARVGVDAPCRVGRRIPAALLALHGCHRSSIELRTARVSLSRAVTSRLPFGWATEIILNWHQHYCSKSTYSQFAPQVSGNGFYCGMSPPTLFHYEDLI